MKNQYDVKFYLNQSGWTLILFLTSLLFQEELRSQTTFLDSSFAVSVTTYDYTTIDEQILQLDLYQPATSLSKHPLIVHVHGGGFSGGSRDRHDVAQYCGELASRGYLVASISYRLTMKGIGFGCDVRAPQKVKAINNASIDASHAIKYLIKHKSTHKIDTEKIILSGSSAGAETILNMAYVFDPEILPPDHKYAGLISMAGAITTLDKIDKNSVIPSLFFHGTEDPLVPYATAPHHFCQEEKPGYLILHGSASIAQRLKSLGSSYYLYSIKDGNHDWAESPKHLCLEEIVDFLYHDIMNVEQIRQNERLVEPIVN